VRPYPYPQLWRAPSWVTNREVNRLIEHHGPTFPPQLLFALVGPLVTDEEADVMPEMWVDVYEHTVGCRYLEIEGVMQMTEYKYVGTRRHP
jgi:hypothetical protein